MDEITLYTVTHKKDEFNLKDRTFIHVGGGKDNKLLCDDAGLNISNKNNYYCELTAIYWIWKNSTSSIVGLEHYRRFFGIRITHVKNYFILYKDDIKKILSSYDIILPDKAHFDKSILERYKENLDEHDFDIVREIILNKYPNYIAKFDEVLNSKEAGMCNMMICNKEVYDSYCKWLFDILFELEKKIDPSIRIGYRKRTFGYVSERLMDVWVGTNNLKVKRVPMLRIDKGRIWTLLRWIKGKLNLPLKGNPMEGK